MQNKLMRLAAKVSAVAMVVSMVAPTLVAHAALPTNIQDKMSRLEIGIASVTHELTATSITLATTGSVVFTYSGFTAISAASACTIGGAAVTCAESAGNVMTVTNDTAPKTGALVVTFTATNPSSAGSKDVTLTGAFAGVFQVAILADDTINVTASITQTFSYDIMVMDDVASCATGSNSNDYLVEFGTMTPAVVDAPALDVICQKLATNANEGAIVQVKSLNGGLKNALADNYLLDSVSEDLDAGGGDDTEGFGMCNLDSNEIGTFGTWSVSSLYDEDCADVGAIVSSGWTEVANTITEPIVGGTVAGHYNALTSELRALASSSSPSGDYAEELTFRAYATF